jgi:hypothetical protein
MVIALLVFPQAVPFIALVQHQPVDELLVASLELCVVQLRQVVLTKHIVLRNWPVNILSMRVRPMLRVRVWVNS